MPPGADSCYRVRSCDVSHWKGCNLGRIVGRSPLWVGRERAKVSEKENARGPICDYCYCARSLGIPSIVVTPPSVIQGGGTANLHSRYRDSHGTTSMYRDIDIYANPNSVTSLPREITRLVIYVSLGVQWECREKHVKVGSTKTSNVSSKAYYETLW